MLHPGEVVENYRVESFINSGGFAEVYLVTHLFYNRLFAAKLLTSDSITAKNELHIMEQLDHRNILRVYDSIRIRDPVNQITRQCFILDYCSNGTMIDYVATHGKLSCDQFKRFAHEVSGALAMIHDQHIAHRDIKPSNILLDDYGHPKLADFGFSLQTQTNINMFAGSLVYLPPEILYKKDHDPFKADMWSLGVTFYYLLTGHIPWTPEKLAMVQEIKGGLPHHDDSIDPEIWSIFIQLMNPNPDSRLTAQQLLDHPNLQPNPNGNDCLIKPAATGLRTGNRIPTNERGFAKSVSLSPPVLSPPESQRLLKPRSFLCGLSKTAFTKAKHSSVTRSLPPLTFPEQSVARKLTF